MVLVMGTSGLLSELLSTPSFNAHLTCINGLAISAHAAYHTIGAGRRRLSMKLSCCLRSFKSGKNV